ncbi:MAG: Uma2 family endonuclease, partial [Stigonema ocellatum SAG 48.90 = DSM 106950]|nr:Uma2 family endonuclease [Stigonema ocellatum SAG 48.90 = DSM 106950]
HTPEYFWFSPLNWEFMGFELVGNSYQEIIPNAQGRRWSQVLGLYLGVEAGKLRYFTTDGDLVPTPEEVAIAAQQVAIEAQQQIEAAQQQVEASQQQIEASQQQVEAAQQQRVMEVELSLAQERQRVAELAQQLRSLGVDPDSSI